MQEPRTWQNQFTTDVAVPSEIQQLVTSGVIEDTSWGNDAMPSFTFNGYEPTFHFRDSQPTPPTTYRLWVNYPDKGSHREIGVDEPRFTIVIDHEGNLHSAIHHLLSSDDLQIILDAITARFFAEYVHNGGTTCPWPDCESNDIESDKHKKTYDDSDSPITCNGCGREWTELYRLTGVSIDEGQRQFGDPQDITKRHN